MRVNVNAHILLGDPKTTNCSKQKWLNSQCVRYDRRVVVAIFDSVSRLRSCRINIHYLYSTRHSQAFLSIYTPCKPTHKGCSCSLCLGKYIDGNALVVQQQCHRLKLGCVSFIFYSCVCVSCIVYPVLRRKRQILCHLMRMCMRLFACVCVVCLFKWQPVITYEGDVLATYL